MSLFISLDDPTQEKLTAFIHMQKKRQHRPLPPERLILTDCGEEETEDA